MPEAIEVDVSGWEPIQLEARGSGANQWRQDPHGVPWLYKATRRASRSGQLQGEDWAEKVAERVASSIGLPCARVELAYVQKAGAVELGVIGRDLREPGTEFQNGANLLADIPGYRYRDSRDRPPRNHVGHSVPNIVERLRAFDVRPPVGTTGVSTAVAAFAGYLVLDAWIGNLDRHEENWAVLRDGNGVVTLAASYDHGAALGASLTDARRAALAADPAGLTAYAAKAFARKFEDGANVPLTSVASDALDRAGTAARAHWSSALEAVQLDDIRAHSTASRECRSLLVPSANNCWSSTGGGCSMTVDEVATVVRVAHLHHRLMVTEKDAAGFYRPVGILGAPAAGQYTFHYLREAVGRTGFRPFLGFSDTGRSYRSDGLFPLFAERIMDPRRPEHPMFLAALDLTDDVTPLEVLARSGGQRAGDGIMLLPIPEVEADGSTHATFLVHGMRYVPGADERVGRLVHGDVLFLRPEPDNETNARAVLVVEGDDGPLGYVPDVLLDFVHSVDDARVTVVRVNGSEVGTRLRLLVRLDGRADPDDQPFTGPGWETVD